MGRHYHILDVFTDTKLTGNPLAVVLDGVGLADAEMQSIAREFNLSETVFVFEPRDPVNFARLRIFTPARELPFAGHPTVGTAVLLATTKAPDRLRSEEVGMVLEETIGLVSCSVRHRPGEAPHARFEVPRVAECWADLLAAEELAAMLGLSATDIGFADHKPTGFSAGVPFTFVPVASIEALGRAGLSTVDADEPAAFYLYTPADAGPTRTFRTRMLASGLGVNEDPATGSAAAAFGGVLLANDGLRDGAHDCFLHQGVEMGRPSRIGVAFSVANGRLESTTIGGSAVLVAQGVLDL